MDTRRSFLCKLSSAPLLLEAGSLFRAAAEPASPAGDLTQFVKPSIGTGGHGHTYPGATVPFGMVQLSPDTFTSGWDWCSGYHVSDGSIMGFSHTHLSGTGIGDMLDVLLMPGTGPSKIVPGTREHPEEGYRSRFQHSTEEMTPGYYSVLLSDYNIKAELSATERAGIHRYTFPESDSAHFILDLHHAQGEKPRILWSRLEVIGNDTIVGGRSTSIWAKGREIYFTMKFSKPFESVEILSDDRKLEPGTRRAEGNSLKCLLHFKSANREVVVVKTGLSGVSVEGSAKNLNAEIPTWDFETVRKAAKAAWQKELSKVRIETGNGAHREIFYTSLYHAYAAPTILDDVDGKYRGMDGKVHELPQNAHNYSTFSLWDTYRAAHPLYTLLQRDRVSDMVNCLVRMSEESPAGVPVWPLQAKETACMTGYHSAVVMAEALAKGFKGIDWARAYGPMRKRAFADDYRGLGHYRKFGYMPCDLDVESVSTTLAYAYDDWAVAHLARAAGAMDDYETLKMRSRNYRNLFEKETGFMRPRFQNGEWAEPFDPKEITITKKWRDYTESNAWQETFANQHDVKEYMELFGGRQAFVQKLDALFNQSTDLPPDTPPDVAGLVGMYAHGNEPSHHIAYLYCYAGAPYKTQERVRDLLENMYHSDPDGMAGNEDCGQMSAWYVISALGFYPVDPVSGNYVFGTPLFDRATVDMAPGRKLEIVAQRKSPDDRYIQAITLNGSRYSKTWFRHADIAAGGQIVFHMGPTPNKSFGSDAGEAPPSFS